MIPLPPPNPRDAFLIATAVCLFALATLGLLTLAGIGAAHLLGLLP